MSSFPCVSFSKACWHVRDTGIIQFKTGECEENTEGFRCFKHLFFNAFLAFFYLVVFPLLLQCYISLCSLIVMALNCVSSTFLAVRNVKPAPCKHVIKDYLLILKQTWFLLFWHFVLRYTNSSFLRVAALICQLRLFIHSHSLQSVFIQDSDQQWFIRVGFFHPIWSLFI